MRIEQYKFGEKGTKYEVVRTILITELINKYKSDKYWLKIYTDLEYNKKKFSVYLMNYKRKKEFGFVISKENIDVYDYEDFIERGGRVIEIDLNDLDDDINNIKTKIKKIIEKRL